LSKIAQHYGLPFKETLTGFKWLAKIPNLWFGYEEALGYAVDSKSVNDKDGISAALVLAQLATDLKAEGKTLVDLLDEIWERHGYHGTKQISVRTTSVAQIDAILSKFRDATPATIGRFSLTAFDDLEKPQDGLPPTNGVRIRLMDNIRIIVRPSGTEPKIKCYIEVITKDRATSEKIIAELEKELHTFLS
jgi:phosphomannomutase